MERKFDQESDTSSEKQGTYYQFLIERKVPKGTLRHIASLINVTYEFVPDNIDIKRRKITESSEARFEYSDEMKENSNLLSNLRKGIIGGDLTALKNLELKRQEDKAVKANNTKESEIARTTKSSKPVIMTKCNEKKTKEDKDIITICKKSRSQVHTKKEDNGLKLNPELSFLKKQKLIP